MNEEGAEAPAAATAVVVATAGVSPEPETFSMIVDRPFFFAIRDNPTVALLFTGSIVDL